jgi:hypothetical protein
MSTAPSLIDWVSLLGVVGSGWAALAARSKAKAVQDSISSTRSQIVTAHLRQAIDEINRLSDMLHQAVKEGDPRGARYILVWLSRECGRSSTLISRAKIQDSSRSADAETITELLDRVASGASRAKGKLVSDDSKLESATKVVLKDLGELERDLTHVATIIGYGMEESNVHDG